MRLGKKRNASGEVAHKVDLADGQLEILSSPVTVNSFIGCLCKRGPAISMKTPMIHTIHLHRTNNHPTSEVSNLVDFLAIFFQTTTQKYKFTISITMQTYNSNLSISNSASKPFIEILWHNTYQGIIMKCLLTDDSHSISYRHCVC